MGLTTQWCVTLGQIRLGVMAERGGMGSWQNEGGDAHVNWHKQTHIAWLHIIEVDKDREVRRINRSVISQPIPGVATAVAVAVPAGPSPAGPARVRRVEWVPVDSHQVVVDYHRSDSRAAAAELRLATCSHTVTFAVIRTTAPDAASSVEVEDGRRECAASPQWL